METMGNALSCSGKERARVEMGGEDQTEEKQTVAITTAETLTPVWNNIRESETSRKRTRQVAGEVQT